METVPLYGIDVVSYTKKGERYHSESHEVSCQGAAKKLKKRGACYNGYNVSVRVAQNIIHVLYVLCIMYCIIHNTESAWAIIQCIISTVCIQVRGVRITAYIV